MNLLLDRKKEMKEGSYTTYLFEKGLDKILKKVIEEAGEILMASKDGNKLQIIKEIADEWFHTMVLLAHHGLRPEDVLMELKRRQNISGLDEKASRTTA